MAVNGIFFKLYNVMGNYRNLLSSRVILPIYQPVATLKKTVEESLGLPPKPKRPLTPYFRFMGQFRPSFVHKYPDLKPFEITKMLALEWQKATEQLKSKLQKEYEENLEAYHKIKADYDSSITDKQKQEIETTKLMRKHEKERKLQRKMIRRLGKPKRPGSAFALWVGSLGEKRGSMKLSDWQKTLIPKWETLPENEREVFEKKAAEAMNTYRLERKKWEAKMIQIGNHDLVRYGMQLNPQITENKNVAE